MIISKYLPEALLWYDLFKKPSTRLQFYVDNEMTHFVFSEPCSIIDDDSLVVASSTDRLPYNIGNLLNTVTEVIPVNISLVHNALISSVPNEWRTGDKVRVSSNIILPDPLQALTDYYVYRFTDSSFGLATSFDKAVKGDIIAFNDVGAGIITVTVVGAVFYFRKVTEISFKLARNLDEAPETIIDYGNGEHFLEFWSNAPSATDIIQTIVGEQTISLDDIRHKYKSFFNTNTDIAREIMSEFGFGYMNNILALHTKAQQDMLSYFPLLFLLKGQKFGMELSLDLINPDYSLMQEWWEQIPQGVPDTFFLNIEFELENVLSDPMVKLLTFIRNYVYPVVDLQLVLKTRMAEAALLCAGFIDEACYGLWAPAVKNLLYEDDDIILFEYEYDHVQFDNVSNPITSGVGYSFAPSHIHVTVNGANVTNADFVTVQGYSISPDDIAVTINGANVEDAHFVTEFVSGDIGVSTVWKHPLTAGTNHAIFVAVGVLESDQEPLSIFCNGEAMQLVSSSSLGYVDRTIFVYTAVNLEIPEAEIEVNFSSGSFITTPSIVAVSYRNVDQDMPLQEIAVKEGVSSVMSAAFQPLPFNSEYLDFLLCKGGVGIAGAQQQVIYDRGEIPSAEDFLSFKVSRSFYENKTTASWSFFNAADDSFEWKIFAVKPSHNIEEELFY